MYGRKEDSELSYIESSTGLSGREASTQLGVLSFNWDCVMDENDYFFFNIFQMYLGKAGLV